MRRLFWFLALLPAQMAWGWGADGHQIVGEIASRHLSPETQVWVNELLSQTGSGEATLAAVSTWADRVRPTEQWQYTAPWHYVNLPNVPGVTYDAARDCGNGDCVVAAIELCRDILMGRVANEITSPEALMFLVHFVGDVHQPLHTGHAEDRGGNGIDVIFFGEQANLHSVWDSRILGHTGRSWPDSANLFDARLTPEQRRAWSDTDPAAWANESYRLAVDVAYAIPADHVIGDEYQSRSLPIVEQRLLQAGVRLAAILNEITAPATIATGILLSAAAVSP